jgi:hypothetical protein
VRPLTNAGFTSAGIDALCVRSRQARKAEQPDLAVSGRLSVGKWFLGAATICWLVRPCVRPSEGNTRRGQAVSLDYSLASATPQQ